LALNKSKLSSADFLTSIYASISKWCSHFQHIASYVVPDCQNDSFMIFTPAINWTSLQIHGISFWQAVSYRLPEPGGAFVRTTTTKLSCY